MRENVHQAATERPQTAFDLVMSVTGDLACCSALLDQDFSGKEGRKDDVMEYVSARLQQHLKDREEYLDRVLGGPDEGQLAEVLSELSGDMVEHLQQRSRQPEVLAGAKVHSTAYYRLASIPYGVRIELRPSEPAPEVLVFQNHIFHDGINVTVRKGTKWADRVCAGDEVTLGDPFSSQYQLLRGRICGVLVTPLISIPKGVLRMEHDPECRDHEGLLRVMRDVYDECDEDTVMTVLFFTVQEET